ncbi:hypothetical protein TUMEXPCC7403_14805 [Tumidithrix helvetica PCC 7403]
MRHIVFERLRSARNSNLDLLQIQVIPFSKNDATHLFEKTALCAELKPRSVENLREIGMKLVLGYQKADKTQKKGREESRFFPSFFPARAKIAVDMPLKPSMYQSKPNLS